MARGRHSKTKDLQLIWKLYQEKTGQTDVDMNGLANYCEQMGWPMPEPSSAHAMLVKQLTRVARQTTRLDEVSGNPYRAYHCVEERHGQQVLSLWRDINEAPRDFMHKSMRSREDQTTNDLVQMSFDTEHWNRINPDELPLSVNTDLTLAVEIRKYSPKRIGEPSLETSSI